MHNNFAVHLSIWRQTCHYRRDYAWVMPSFPLPRQALQGLSVSRLYWSHSSCPCQRCRSCWPWPVLKSLSHVKYSSKSGDFLRFYAYLCHVITILLVLICSTKISEKSDMTKSWAARLSPLCSSKNLASTPNDVFRGPPLSELKSLPSPIGLVLSFTIYVIALVHCGEIQKRPPRGTAYNIW